MPAINLPASFTVEIEETPDPADWRTLGTAEVVFKFGNAEVRRWPIPADEWERLGGQPADWQRQYAEEFVASKVAAVLSLAEE